MSRRPATATALALAAAFALAAVRPSVARADDEVSARERAMRARYGDRDAAEQRRAFRRADRLRS